MKKLLFLFDTDDSKVIHQFKDAFKDDFIMCNLSGLEIWEIDEENNMIQIK